MARWLRSTMAGLLMTLGVVFAAASLIVGWAGAIASNTTAFTTAYVPILGQPTVRSFLADATAKAVVEHIDLGQIVPKSSAPLVTEKLRLAVREGAVALFSSDGFQPVWAETLRVAHQQFVGLLEGDEAVTMAVTRDGGIGLSLPMLSDQLKQHLVRRGVPFADQLPSATGVIVLASTDKVMALRPWYRGLRFVAAWLPILAVVLIAVATLISPRRRTILVFGGIVAAVLAVVFMLLVASSGTLASAVLRAGLAPIVPAFWWLAGGGVAVALLAGMTMGRRRSAR